MEKKEIVFVCISDTHTHTENLKLPAGDVLIHAGDFTYLGRPKEVSEFNEFLGKQNFKYKIVIAGNHDLTFDLENYEAVVKLRKIKRKHAKKVKDSLTNCIYLEDSFCEVFGYKIYGSPWQITYPDWAFFADPEINSTKKWKQIPTDTDIIITHNPPFNIMDKCEDNSQEGSLSLFNEIMDRIKPKIHVFGHVHEGYGTVKMGETIFINASTCDADYEPVNPAIVFTLPMKEKLNN